LRKGDPRPFQETLKSKEKKRIGWERGPRREAEGNLKLGKEKKKKVRVARKGSPVGGG